jgi:formylglycine-generating enzyme required for sulfatase activity
MQLRLARIVALAFGLAGASFPASAQVTPYGSGINPANSLAWTAGIPWIGSSFELRVSDTAAANPLPGLAYLYLASQPAPGFPAGLVLPGLGLGSSGSSGELLLDVLPPNPFLALGPEYYTGNPSTAKFSVNVPSNPTLVGIAIFAQGLLVHFDQGSSPGLTNALQITLAAPGGPIPGVTPIPGLAIIQPGTFLMGSNAASGAPYFGESDEHPVHPVTISKPFWMGTTEVTQAQYQALMGTNPSSFVGASRPVERVSWVQARWYCEALTAQQSVLGNVPPGYQYRLPTEAEWEYACRAGTTTEFNLGGSLFCAQARFGWSQHSNRDCNGPRLGTVPVGSYPPNAWGLHDMHGNVFEWCLDSHAAYPAFAVTDPLVGGSLLMVVRGGGSGMSSSSCRSGNRDLSPIDVLYHSGGFRVVLAPVKDL